MKKFLAVFLILSSMTILCDHNDNHINNAKKTLNLVFRTYLTPSIPQGFYELIVSYLNEKTNFNVSLSIELEHSGPPPDQPDPFATGEIHIAQMCAPAFIKLDKKNNASIELLGLVPFFKDPRIDKQPIYFSDIIVATDSSITSFKDLRGKKWCYNDLESLSGYFCMLQYLASINETTGFFSNIIQSNGHLQSMQLVAQGKIDVAAIDSNALSNFLKKYPEFNNKIHVIKSLGPFPIQPFVVSKNLPHDIRDIIKQALLTMAVEKKDELENFLVEGFCIITNQHYNEERQLLRTCEHLIKGTV